MDKRKLKYVGHAIRNSKTALMATVLQGKVDAPRKKGRPSLAYDDNIKEVSRLKMGEISQESRDRDRWRNIVEASCGAANIEADDADR